MARAAVLFADGFEEIEAIAIVDVLRRAGVEVLMTGLGEASRVTGSHDIELSMDCRIADLDVSELDAVLLPGGMPGAKHLAEDPDVQRLVTDARENDKLIGAICAAPMALAAAGIMDGVRFTCYPGFETQVSSGIHTDSRVERDGRIITARGPGAVIEFALELVHDLVDAETSAQLKSGMQVYAP